MESPHARGAGLWNHGTDFRLDEEEAEGRFEIHSDRSRRRGPVDRPPLYDSL
jgi:hypothetical protein